MAARLPFAVVFAVIGLLFAWGVASRAVGVDFPQFWFVGQSLDRPGLNVYSQEDRARLGTEFLDKAQQNGNARLIGIAEYRRNFETYSSPFLYSCFRFFSTGDYDVDLRNFHLLSVACLVLSVILISRTLHIAWDITLMAVGLFAGWFSPFASDLRVGNVNSIQLLTLAVCFWATLRAAFRYRDFLVGAVLGLTLAFKPNLIFVPAMLALASIFDRNWFRLINLTIGTIAGIIAAISFSALSFGSLHCWLDWISALRSMPSDIISLEHGNLALSQLLGSAVASRILAVLFLGVAIAMIWRCGPTHRAKLAFALACLLTVLAPGLVWLHYHVLVIPAVLIVVAELSAEPSRSSFRCVFLTVALLGYCFETLSYIAPPLPSMLQAMMVFIPSLLLFDLIVWPITRSRSEPA